MKTRRALLRICSINLLLPLLCLAAPAHAEPQVEATLAAETVSTGAPFTLSLSISWQGEADQYIIAPPQPELPEAVEQISSSFSSSASEDVQRMHYSFVLRAVKDGEYAIKPVAVKYWAKGETQESTIFSQEISFKAVAFAALKKNQGFLIIGAVACMLAGVGAGFYLIRRKKLRKKTAANAEASPVQIISQLLQTCRTSKIQGDYAGFYEAAIELGRLLPEQDSALSEKLASMLEKIRFGGLRPPAEEIERLLRQLEKSAEKILSAGAEKNPDYKKYCK
jgi:hypothetical protein